MKLHDLAQRLALNVEGEHDGNMDIEKLASVQSAGPGDLTFVVSAKYQSALSATNASAVLIPASLAEHAPCAYLVCDSPYAAYAKASWLLHPDHAIAPGVANSATVHPSASVPNTCSIGEFAVIGPNVTLAENVSIGAHCTLGSNVSIGADTRLMPNVSVAHHCQIGSACRVQSGAVIGSEGFGFAPTKNGWQAIHQVGRVVVGNRVHIGANTTIDRGALDDTEIADGVILDNQIQIAHNVKIGENTAIAGCVGIAGSTTIGAHCQIGGACNIVGHISIADGVVLNAASTITQSIEQAGRYGSAMPLMPVSRWRRVYVAISQLDQLAKRVRKLERS